MYNDPGLLPGLIAAIVLGGAGLLVLTWLRTPREAARMFLTAFVVRFALSVVIYQFGLVSVLKDEDASGWVAGPIIAQSWSDKDHSLVEIIGIVVGAAGLRENHSYSGYFHLLAIYFYLNNAPYRLVAAALNCLFGAVIPVMVYSTAKILFTERIARHAGWWACLMPSLVIWSAMTIKEPVVICLETIALYACAHLRKRSFSPGHFVLALSCVALLLPFRFYASYLIGMALLLSLFVPDLNSQGRTISGLLLGGAAVALMMASGWLAHAEERFDRMGLDQIEAVRTYSASVGGSASAVQTPSIRSEYGMLIGLSVGALHLLLAPFPWQLGGGSIRMLLTLPELLVWWWLLFYGVLPGLVWVLRRQLVDNLPMLVLLLGFGSLYSLTFGNVGLVFRQRAQLLPWLLILAMVGLELHRQRRARFAALRKGTNPTHGGGAIAAVPALERGTLIH